MTGNTSAAFCVHLDDIKVGGDESLDNLDLNPAYPPTIPTSHITPHHITSHMVIYIIR
jgi:hypothetical protein